MSHIVLIPAAGIGSRFGAPMPKQYAHILGKPVLQHTLSVFAANSRIKHIAVIIAPHDTYFDTQITLPENALVYRVGGNSRAQTVTNGLDVLFKHRQTSDNDLILVHDAARCCLTQNGLNRLLDALSDPKTQQTGAILAIPVIDTLKQQTDSSTPHIARTVSRTNLWNAQTPQAFQAALLRRALAQTDLAHTTDDASAVERLGVHPKLVMGESHNIKLTHADDAALAEWLLQHNAA